MMSDTIKLPENNYAFKRTYEGNNNFRFEGIGGTKPVLQKKPEREKIQYISKDFKPNHKEHKEDKKTSLQFCDREIYKKHKFEIDMFKLSDYEFVNWANQHSKHFDFLLMAVMAEMKKSPKMRDEIESLRSEVYKIPLMPIHEYKKIRKLGDRYTSFLRQLKHEYGNHLLRLLYLTSSSNLS
jgi:hypothetical protein